MDWLVMLDSSGAVLADMSLAETNRRRWQHPWHLVHRGHLHQSLKQAATAVAAVDDGAASSSPPPARLHTSSRVVRLDPEEGRVWLESGETVTADVVIGADGVSVSTYRHVSSYLCEG